MNYQMEPMLPVISLIILSHSWFMDSWRQVTSLVSTLTWDLPKALSHWKSWTYERRVHCLFDWIMTWNGVYFIDMEGWHVMREIMMTCTLFFFVSVLQIGVSGFHFKSYNLVEAVLTFDFVRLVLHQSKLDVMYIN